MSISFTKRLRGGACTRQPWIWDEVRDHLQRPAQAIEISGRSTREGRQAFTLEGGIAELAALLDAQTTDRIVLVGHSVAGLLALGAASERPHRVARVVLVGTHVPAPGRSHLSLAPAPMRLLLPLVFKLSRDGVVAPAASLRAEYCHGLDEATSARVIREATREPARLFTDPWPAPAVPSSVDVVYVRLTKDRAVPPEIQSRSSQRANARRVDIGTGHLPMLSEPRALARIIEADPHG